MEPAVKLTWTLLKGGLRLSAELLLTLSNSALFGFIFRACLERVKEKSQETDGKRYPACTCAWRLKPRAASAWSLPIHTDTVQPFTTPQHLIPVHSSSFSGTWGSHPTDTEQVIGLQPPCQPPMTNQLCLSRERTTEPTASSLSLRLLCLAHAGPWTTSHLGRSHWEAGTHQCLPSVKFSREGSGITPPILQKGRLRLGVRTQFLHGRGVSGRRVHP